MAGRADQTEAAHEQGLRRAVVGHPNEQRANALASAQRGSGGKDASVAKRNIVVEWKS